MTSLSLVIVALNEERTIGQVIAAALPIVNEIILVDSGSTDQTREIAVKHGARVFHQDWLGYAAQKNFAMNLASSDWILSLDADEIMTPKLVAEIETVLQSPTSVQWHGFAIPRVLYIAQKPVWHGGFYPDAQLRLIQRGKGQFAERLVHEAIKVQGPVKTLKCHMDHFSYVDVAQFEQALEKYAQLSAKEFVRSKKSGAWKTSRLNEVFHPMWTFFYRYFLRLGILDGVLGLELAVIYSNYVRKKIAYSRQLVRSEL